MWIWNKIVEFWDKCWEYNNQLSEIAENDPPEWLNYLCVFFGIFLFEYLYFVNAEFVRLLYVIIIIIPGLIIGFILSHIIRTIPYYFLSAILIITAMAALGLVAYIGFNIVSFLINTLYNTIIHTN